VGKGVGFSPQEENILGIVLLPSRLLCYDDQGKSLDSPISGLSRDRGFAAVQQKGLINIEDIDDPGIRLFLNVLRRTFADPTKMAFEAARIYMQNIEEVNRRVLSKGITSQIREQFQESLPLFIGFLAGEGLSTILLRTANPVAAGIGAALKVSLALAGYAFQIDFAGSTMQLLLEAASHLVRVRKIEGEKLGALDSIELDKAAVPLRKIVIDVAQVAIASGLGRGLGFLLRLAKGRLRLRLECNTCNIKTTDGFLGEPGKGETKSSEGQEAGTAKTETTGPAAGASSGIRKTLAALSEDNLLRILFRIVRKDPKGRSFGTPGHPNPPTIDEFNPSIEKVPAKQLESRIARQHALNPEQAASVRTMDNAELVRFRAEDPISVARGSGKLTGGHHRSAEIARRVAAGELPPDTAVEVLSHD
jgi:hypothetical protein